MFKNNKGFTLVELLAVIVILAIIMIIAIPAVLNTMQTAKRKSMLEYAQKVMNKAEEMYMSKQLTGDPYPLPTDYTEIYFDVTKDLGLSSTGDFKGVTTLLIYPYKIEKGVCIYNSDSLLFYTSEVGELKESYIQPLSNFNGALSGGKTMDDVNIKRWLAYTTFKTRCNYHKTSAIDASTNNMICSIHDRGDKYGTDYCSEDYYGNFIFQALSEYFSYNEYSDECTGV